MNPWARQTRQLVTTSNYLDQLQLIYTHEDGERNVDATLLASIVNSVTIYLFIPALGWDEKGGMEHILRYAHLVDENVKDVVGQLDSILL